MNELRIPGTLESREVAKMIGKEHKNLLANIRTYIQYMEGGQLRIQPSDFFVESTYINEQNKQMPCFLVTKQGCETIAHKLTGAKGIQFTALYVAKFNAMEQGLAALPTDSESGKHLEAEARLNNSRARVSSEYRKLSEHPDFPKEYRQIMLSKATEALSGTLLLPLPKTDRRTYSATEIGEVFGISANRVGHLANEHSLKTSEYGVEAWDKSPYSPKQVQSWRYYDTVIPAFARILGMDIPVQN